jgi:DtxR family Mn-dependent transcriptional regulator
LRLAPGSDLRTLLSLEPGESALVADVPDGDAELLRYLRGLGLVPGSSIEVTSVAPFSGPVTVRTEAGEHAISSELAATIGIAK